MGIRVKLTTQIEWSTPPINAVLITRNLNNAIVDAEDAVAGGSKF